MSLFSRLERIREKSQEGDAKESGMFGVADLGSQDEGGATPVAATPEEPANEAPVAAIPMPEPEPAPATMPAEAEPPAPPFSSMQDLPSMAAAPEAPAAEAPSAEAPSGGSPFDRLMANRSEPAAEAAESTGVDSRLEKLRERAAPREPESNPLARVEDPAAERDAKLRGYFRHKHLIFDAVLGSLDPRLLQNPQRETMRAAIDRSLEGALREYNLSLDNTERGWMVDEFLRETMDLGPIVPLLEEQGVNKVMITGAGDVSVEKLGRIERTGISFRDDDHLLSLIRRVAESVGGRIDAKVPLLDRPLPDGARIRAKIPPMSPQPSLIIEKTTGNPFTALKRAQQERGRNDLLPYAQLRERIQQRLLREFETDSLTLSNQERLRSQVEEMINNVILEERVAVTRAERAALVMDLLNEIVGLGPIEPLLNDPEIDEVMVNGPYQIYVERKGKLELAPQRFRDNNHVM